MTSNYQNMNRNTREEDKAFIKEAWDYYSALDRDTKRDFILDISVATGWRKSTFYTRLHDGLRWRRHEYKTVAKVLQRYKNMYPYG